MGVDQENVAGLLTGQCHHVLDGRGLGTLPVGVGYEDDLTGSSLSQSMQMLANWSRCWQPARPHLTKSRPGAAKAGDSGQFALGERDRHTAGDEANDVRDDAVVGPAQRAARAP